MRVLNKYLLIAFFLLYPTLAFSQDLGLMRLSYIEGDVQVLIKDTTDWTPAAINLPLSEGDRIWVAEEGKAELQIRGGVYARMDGNTALDILTISPIPPSSILTRAMYISTTVAAGSRPSRSIRLSPRSAVTTTPSCWSM